MTWVYFMKQMHAWDLDITIELIVWVPAEDLFKIFCAFASFGTRQVRQTPLLSRMLKIKPCACQSSRALKHVMSLVLHGDYLAGAEFQCPIHVMYVNSLLHAKRQALAGMSIHGCKQRSAECMDMLTSVQMLPVCLIVQSGGNS